VISSQTRHYIAGFDEIVQASDDDFGESGLKVESVIRVGCLAVVSGEILLGAIGQVSHERLERVKKHLSGWLSEK
jgi:mRNA interferase MazF